LFFRANDGIHGTELWKSDGTPDGTVLVKDIWAGTTASGSSVLVNVDGKLLFAANDGIHGFQAWQSDGTEAGTRLLASVVPPLFSSATSQFVAVSGRLLFVADDGVHGLELWTTADINAAPSFVKGPNVTVTDEETHVAPTTVIALDALHGGPDAPFYFYRQDGFSVRPIDGRWLEAQEGTHVTGNPGPGLWGDAYTGALEVTRPAGGLFSFHSVDVTTWTFGTGNDSGQYTITGLRGGQTVFSKSGAVPVYETSGFVTVDSPSLALVDTVRLSFVRGTQSYVVDNIRLIQPPAGGAPWATGISAGPPDEAGQTVNFVVIGNTNPDLFAVPPSIDPAGNLIFAPRPNGSGSATITVVLHDSGGTAGGGVDTSPPQSFVITVDRPHPWRNTINRLDVTADGFVVAADALEVINYINAFANIAPPPRAFGEPPYLDVNGDDFAAPNDALEIINYLNSLPATSPAATFLAADSTTQGNWQAAYGADGYAMALGAANLPAYATVTPYANTHLWTNATADVRALAQPGSTDRLAAAWQYNYNGFVVDVNLQDDKTHRVALYLLDWDGNDSRGERIDILDAATGAVLNSQTATAFSSGKYLVWLLKGHVQIRVTPLVADDVHTAVSSGIFFG
jgi:ELWxxDGT repeat protein